MHFKTSHDSNVRALTGWTWLKRNGALDGQKTLPALLETRPFGGLVGPELPQLQKGGERSTLLYLRCWPKPWFCYRSRRSKKLWYNTSNMNNIRYSHLRVFKDIYDNLIIMKNEVSWTWLLFFIIFCHCPWQWASYPVHESTTVAVSYTPSFEHPLNHPVLVLNMRILCPGLLFQHVSTASILEELCLQRAKRSTDFK
jgi:hypothetical protein